MCSRVWKKTMSKDSFIENAAGGQTDDIENTIKDENPGHVFNDSFEDMADVLKASESVLIFPHINGDGDAIGSSAALCKALRKLNKSAYVLVEDKIPDNLKFMDKEYFTEDFSVILNPDVCICVDCGETKRFPKRKRKFAGGKTTICIDHHGTSTGFCDYNHIDPGSAATGQLIYKLILAMGVELDKETGEAIFAAITTDTGNFQYSNTSKETHEIVAKLYEAGIDANAVSVELYERVSLKKINLEADILSRIRIYADGKLALGYVSEEMLRKHGAALEDAEGVVARLRSIDGVEIAAFVKEHGEESCRVSLRAKRVGDVSEIAEAFGGGGHVKAAGCTIHMNLEETIKAIKAKALESLASCKDGI